MSWIYAFHWLKGLSISVRYDTIMGYLYKLVKLSLPWTLGEMPRQFRMTAVGSTGVL